MAPQNYTAFTSVIGRPGAIAGHVTPSTRLTLVRDMYEQWINNYEDRIAMLSTSDYIVFREACQFGYLEVVRHLYTSTAWGGGNNPSMLTAKDFDCINSAIAEGRKEVVDQVIAWFLKLDHLGAQQPLLTSMLTHNRFVVFRTAAERGRRDIFKESLFPLLTRDQAKEMVLAEDCHVFRSAVASDNLEFTRLVYSGFNIPFSMGDREGMLRYVGGGV